MKIVYVCVCVAHGVLHLALVAWLDPDAFGSCVRGLESTSDDTRRCA